MKEEKFYAGEIVASVKTYRHTLDTMYFQNDINFVGCSEDYVEEKINALISTLQELKKHLRVVEKRQILNENNE